MINAEKVRESIENYKKHIDRYIPEDDPYLDRIASYIASMFNSEAQLHGYSEISVKVSKSYIEGKSYDARQFTKALIIKLEKLGFSCLMVRSRVFNIFAYNTSKCKMKLHSIPLYLGFPESIFINGNE